ncbi:putative leucine-rich repeat-containing protein DDB_G0290503 [Frieseomelitta varia]|uniref:putative leucine-rich repeat-containing protein DDB_G0290503 n=1 Tax=Frieseomelitta varia TaxID=561572 RepID=UPI001CB67D74|nr:putative leucine-rich repeat-containing protein DDB_G0290503 [Frieseomelitta varia]
MVDLHGKDKGNISLPKKLQSYDDEDEKNLPTIINTQRTFYSIKIADIENRINRLDERNDELLDEIETTNERSAAADAETAEEIANLNKSLSAQNNSIKSLKENIGVVENDRTENRKLHEKKIELFVQQYKKTKVELISRIKVLSNFKNFLFLLILFSIHSSTSQDKIVFIDARINVLEDFKKIQHALEEKLEANQVQMIENERKIKEAMKIINRKKEFDKEMLKNEMYDCLLDLATQFQREVNKYINLPNQRLMRENIMLKNELLQISTRISSIMDVNIILKNAVIDHKKKMNVQTELMKGNIVTAKVQNEMLKRLRKKFYNTKGYFSFINVPDPAVEQKYLMLIEKARQEENDINFQLSSLKTLLHKERTKISVTKYILKKLECKIKALLKTIYDLKYNAICLLKHPPSRKDLVTLSCIELFLFLRDLIIKGQSKFRSHIITKSFETIPRELESVSNIKEIAEDLDFEMTVDFIEKELSKETLDKMKHIEDLEKQMKISIKSSEKSQELLIEDTFKHTVDFQIKNQHELPTDYEFAEESLSDEKSTEESTK